MLTQLEAWSLDEIVRGLGIVKSEGGVVSSILKSFWTAKVTYGSSLERVSGSFFLNLALCKYTT